VRPLIIAAGGLLGAVFAAIRHRRAQADARMWQEATSDSAR
jgi:hypothetical protein